MESASLNHQTLEGRACGKWADYDQISLRTKVISIVQDGHTIMLHHSASQVVVDKLDFLGVRMTYVLAILVY